MASLELVTEFPARKPQILFPPCSYAEIERVWVKPINVIRHAAIALTEDVALFEAMGYHKAKTAAGEEFLHSLTYHAGVLVRDSLVTMKSGLGAYAYTPALTLKADNISIGSLLAAADVAFERLSKLINNLLSNAGWEFRWEAPSTGDMVPTATPYQLLYQLICKDKLHADSSAPTGDEVTRIFSNLQKQVGLMLPELPHGIRVTSDTPCGRPTMVFVAGSLDLSHIVFGANEPTWGDLTALSAITRAARDARLQHYVPKATAAFRALREKEAKALQELQSNSDSASDMKDLLWGARATAIRQIRSDDSFLGGDEEMGIALRPPTWSINQGCYLCQGMMGYKSPKTWNENQRKKYILTF
ncbi:hypothetical protein V8C35DRAFT_295525, partial [Trichoderma chlorosporum]